MVGARLISRLIDLGTMLVLAHILSPKDFGLVAIGMSLIYIVEAALELPISQAIVRLKLITDGHYDTAFTLSSLRGFFLGVVVCCMSFPFAHFYADHRLQMLICVLSLAPIARGMVSPRLADCTRRLDFSPDFKMELAGKVVAFTTAIGLAFFFRTYWAIAAGTVIAPLIGAATSYVLAPYRPRFSLSCLGSFSGFLGWMTAAQVVSAVNWQADRLLLGKLTSKAELGLFTAANDASTTPLSSLFAPMLRPLHAAFSQMKDDRDRLARSYQSTARAVVSLGLPVLVVQSLIARPAVHLVLGDRWMGSARLLHWLALSLIPTLFAVPMGPLVMALGDTKLFFQRNTFELCVKLPLVIVGALKFGFMGVILARFISEVASVCFCMVVVRRLTGLSLRNQFFAPWISLTASALMAILLSPLIPVIRTDAGSLLLLLETGSTAILGGLLYVGVSWILWKMSGSPSGVEEMFSAKAITLLNRLRGRAASCLQQETP